MWWRLGLVVSLGAWLLLGRSPLPGALSAASPGRAQSEQAVADAVAAAERIFTARSTPACVTPNDEGTTCVTLRSTPAEVERGIAVVLVADAGGVFGFIAILGRDPTGAWSVWFTTQNTFYQLLALPGEMMVCAEGAGARVRAAPSLDAAVLDTLPDLTRVTAEEFVLTEERVVDRASGLQEPGAGWYRLSAPLEGWTSSRLLSNTRIDAALGQPDCWARDAREGVGR